ncbi:MAG: hydrolase-like domain, acetyltransferase AlgX, partial [Acidimicrobiia bacterium]|nr:hydrolase-like domain, acetyltransferase AlgX [Acidimicrobiia bacterium]
MPPSHSPPAEERNELAVPSVEPPRPVRDRRKVHYIVLVGFLAFLVVPLALTLAGRRPGASDNRQPSPAPTLGGDALLQASTYQQLDRYLQDRFAFRGLAIRVSAKLNDKLWKGDTDQVRRGKGEWLYYQPSLTQLCTESLSPAAGTNALGQLVSALEAGGKTVRYLLAPEKSSIYPE